MSFDRTAKGAVGLRLNEHIEADGPTVRLRLLRRSRSPECQQDHRRVAMSVPIVCGHLHQALDLALSEVLARPIIRIWQPTGDCSLFSGRGLDPGCYSHWSFPTNPIFTVLIIAFLRIVSMVETMRAHAEAAALTFCIRDGPWGRMGWALTAS